MKDPEKAFDATQYKNQFQKEKYDRIIVNVPKGQKDVIQTYAKEQGYNSLNAFVVDCINSKMNNQLLNIWRQASSLSFFALVHLVQDLSLFFLNLVQDSIFTSCTRCNILNSSNETQQQRKQERPDKAIGLYTSDMAIKLTQVRQSV